MEDVGCNPRLFFMSVLAKGFVSCLCHCYIELIDQVITLLKYLSEHGLPQSAVKKIIVMFCSECRNKVNFNPSTV